MNVNRHQPKDGHKPKPPTVQPEKPNTATYAKNYIHYADRIGVSISPKQQETKLDKPYYYTKAEIILLEDIQDFRSEGLSEDEIIKTLENILERIRA